MFRLTCITIFFLDHQNAFFILEEIIIFLFKCSIKCVLSKQLETVLFSIRVKCHHLCLGKSLPFNSSSSAERQTVTNYLLSLMLVLPRTLLLSDVKLFFVVSLRYVTKQLNMFQ